MSTNNFLPDCRRKIGFQRKKVVTEMVCAKAIYSSEPNEKSIRIIHVL